MSRAHGQAPELMYEPSFCNQALVDRDVPPVLNGIDHGGLDCPTISRMRHTYNGYHAGRGAHIKAARIAAGWTGAELAFASGIPHSTLGHYEINSYAIPHRAALFMADALGITVDELLGISDVPETVAAD